MFTLEEGALLARMLRVIGWVVLCVVAAAVYYLLHHFHPFLHLARTALPMAGLARGPAARVAERRLSRSRPGARSVVEPARLPPGPVGSSHSRARQFVLEIVAAV